MRILHVCQPTDGGAAVVVRQLVEAGVAAGDEVVVACPADKQLSGWVTAAGARWVDLAMTRSPEVADVAHVIALWRLQSHFEVVHAHSSKAGALSRLAAMFRGSRRPRMVFTPHGWSWYVGGRLAKLYRRLERLLSSVSDVITVVSRVELEDGRAVLGERARLQLIENGVDTDDFSPDGPAADRHDAPMVVQVGRLSVQKGQDRSLRALADLTDQSVRLRLVGDGPLERDLHRLAEELGVRERVEFVGAADPRPHLRVADVVVLPSRWEGMSLALLEAMATGSAIITSDCGGSDALGDAGIAVDHGDDDLAVRQLTTHLNRLIASPTERAARGRAARARAEQHYAMRRVVRGYNQV